MAITDIKEYAHLTSEDVESLARELDAIRTDIEESRGERDARYIRRAIQLQRALAVGGRAVLFASRNKVAWGVGTAMLGTAKIIENMELGHNIIHGQWDWMNDPEIHSTEWEWDTTSPSEHWKKSRVTCTAVLESKSLQVKMITDKNRGPDQTYNEIPESIRGTNAS